MVRGRAALLVIDVQNGTFSARDKIARPAFYDAAASRIIPNIQKLLAAFRGARLEVIYTVIEALTEDRRDLSLDYKLSNMGFAKGSPEAQVLAEIAPARDEIVLAKTSSSVFNSTTLDYL
jgi:nicotinamidase-related amidase